MPQKARSARPVIIISSLSRRATPLFVFGTLGAAASTWLIGFVSNQTGNLRSGMYVLVISVALLIVLQIALATRVAKGVTTAS